MSVGFMLHDQVSHGHVAGALDLARVYVLVGASDGDKLEEYRSCCSVRSLICCKLGLAAVYIGPNALWQFVSVLNPAYSLTYPNAR